MPQSRSFLFLAFFLFCNVSCAFAQDISISAATIPAELKEGANSVVRYYEYRWEVVNDHEAKVYVKKVITLLNDKHDAENRVVINYDKSSRIVQMKSTMYDAMGKKIRNGRKPEINDVRAIADSFDGDDRVLTSKLDHNSYPYTVEFEYEKKVSNFSMVAGFPHFVPMGYNQSLEQATFIAKVPADNKLNYWSNEIDDPKVNTTGNQHAYVWTVGNKTARKKEVESPPFTRTMPYLRVALDRFSIDGYSGSMKSWEDFGTFMGKLIAGRDELPAELAFAVHKLTDDLETDREKIAALYRYMQSRTRYVSVQLGIGGWQPFSAEYVEENKYGDCKALSNYMGAMLKEVGIESYPVLISWDDKQFFPAEPEFTVSSFNHMVLYVPEEDMYLECTSQDAPTGYLGSGKEARHVLLVTPTGGKLVKTPSPTAADNGRIRSLGISIKPDGSADVAIRKRMHGAAQEAYRSLVKHEADRTKQLEVLQRWDDIPDMTGERFDIRVEKDEPVAEMNYATSLNNYARKVGKRMFIPINKYDTYGYIPEKNEARRTPIQNTTARFYVDTIKLQFPEGLVVESLGDEEVRIQHAAGDYRANVAIKENTITYIRTLKILPVDLPATEYPEYRQFFVDVAAAEKRKVVLKEQKSR